VPAQRLIASFCKMEENNYSVYIHINKINGKVYIGKTNNVSRRWRCGGVEYKPNKDENQNRPFWNAIQKYGWDGFEHIVLCNNLDDIEASNKEIELIKEYNAIDKRYGYNISIGGNGGKVYSVHPRGMLGKHHTEYQKSIQKDWMSNPLNNCMMNGTVKWGVTHKHPKGMLGKKHTEEYKAKISKIMQNREISEVTRKKMSKAQKGKTVSLETRIKISKAHEGLQAGKNNPNYGIKMSDDQKRKISESKKGRYTGNESPVAKMIHCLELDRTFDTISEAGKLLGIYSSVICLACKGTYKTAGGYHFMYYKDYISGKKYNIENEINKNSKKIICIELNKIFNSIKLAEMQLSIPIGGISKVCSKKQKTAGGYHWMYYEDYLKLHNETNNLDIAI
jgi:group I intron endonuclease